MSNATRTHNKATTVAFLVLALYYDFSVDDLYA